MKYEFPKDFLWGTATSSGQIEGAYLDDGKVLSVWDVFAHNGRCSGDNLDVACDHYHRYKEDVARMAELGVQVYRFSISWPRVISDINGTVNEKGLEFYSNLVDELIKNNIEPWVTFFHWDTPQFLEDAFGAWSSREIVPHFKHYCEVVVKKLGDRVKNWMTINEPCNATCEAYGTGICAPGRKLGNKAYINSVHNILMAHGTAVKAVREFGAKDSKVGIVFNPEAFFPLDDTPETKMWIEKLWARDNGFYMDPIYFGKYPEGTFRNLEGATPDVLPGDMELINQPVDFFGLNAYFGVAVKADPTLPEGVFHKVRKEDERDDCMMPYTPEMFYHLIKYCHDHYPLKEIIITENGNAWVTDTKEEQLEDDYRIDFLKMHLKSIKQAMDEGYQVGGYFTWSFLDNFEWTHGYKFKFGLLHLDENLNRIPKKSFYWYQKLIKDNGFEI